MWRVLRSISDTLGVGFLIMQLIKLIGMVFTLVGPLKFVSSLFAGLFPLIASFFKISFGWTINGLDVMAIAIAVSGTLIVWSSVAREEAMGTRYIFRFFLIPYAFLVILFAIVVQVVTPIVEINHFNSQCKAGIDRQSRLCIHQIAPDQVHEMGEYVALSGRQKGWRDIVINRGR